jgi:hypothetical protein
MSNNTGVSRVLVVALVLAGFAVPVLASFSGTDIFIPSVGRGPGTAGSEWYTCIWVYNPGSTPVNAQYFFLERNQANPTPAMFPDVIQPGAAIRIDNIVQMMFGQANKFGALRVVASEKLFISARVYSKSTGGEDKDSVGQFFAGIPANFAIGSGQSTQLVGVYQTAPQSDSQFRYNFGFVEVTGNAVTVRVTARDFANENLGSKEYRLGAFEPRQYNITDLLSGVDSPNLRLEVQVVAGSGKVVAFGSGLANRSNDPSTFEMLFREELLGGGSGSGLTTVAHDSSLTGDGTSSSKLGIANGGVTQAKLSATGGKTGQVLGTDGSSLTWKDSSGSFSLPYSGSASTAVSTDALRVENTGAGRAFQGISKSDTAVWAVSTSGRGIDGWSQTNDGVVGSTATAGKAGVWGHSTVGIGVNGMSTSAAGVSGFSTSGVGVTGWSTSNDGVVGSTETAGKSGVWGHSTVGIGVNGMSTSAAGVNGASTSGIGVTGRSTSNDGIVGVTETAGKSGVWGHNSKGVGVTGSSSADVGVVGFTSASSSTTAGVVARNTGGGVGLYVEAGTSKQAAILRGNVRLLSYSSGATVMELGEGLDYAEGFDVSDATEPSPGSVLVIDPSDPGRLALSTRPYDRGVAGIVAGANNLGSGVRLGAGGFDVDVALAGRVYCSVDAGTEAIAPGDLLTTSSTPGHAMKATDVARSQGAVLGKAMQPFAKGKRGQILVLVALQ